MSDLVLAADNQSSNVSSQLVGSVSHMSGAFVHRQGTPSAIDAGQAYYWSAKWQRDQAQSRKEHVQGKAITFDTAEGAIRWLLSAGE